MYPVTMYVDGPLANPREREDFGSTKLNRTHFSTTFALIFEQHTERLVRSTQRR